MGTNILASNLLANGLRTEFADTYEKVRIAQSDSRLSQVMDLGIGATNRQHEFAYVEAAPHLAYWKRGETIPTDAMNSVEFTVPVYEYGRRVPWFAIDRSDDQTQSLFDMARQAGTSAANVPERFFFEMIENTTGLLPAIPLAPDGAAMFAATAGGLDRFGVSGGNILSQAGTSAAQIQADYYKCITRFKRFLDGKGQPLLGDGVLEAGVTIVHPLELTEAMEQAFLQTRQVNTTGATPSNVVQEANRRVALWGSPRLTQVDDWYIFLQGAPKRSTFYLDREGVQEWTALREDNNSDSNRAKNEEYIQWELRSGGGVALPFGAIKVA